MKVKFTKFEKVAGLFTLVAFLASFLAFTGVAIKKGWFSPRESFHTTLPSAEGISNGTLVQMSGLKIGAVTDVKLISHDKVEVRFDVFSEFIPQLHSNSRLMVFRPFLIGEKVLEIQVDGEEGEPLLAGAEIPAISSTDLMDVLSGKKMGAAVASLEQMAQSIRVLGEAFADGERAKELIRIVDQLQPLVLNLNQMSKDVTRLSNVALKEKRLEVMIDNLNVLTQEFKKVTPALAVLAPDLPQTSLRAVEALNEAVVLLKAMQKSFFIRGHVETVKEEESHRKPASE